MLQKHKQASLGAIEWLEYQQAINPYPGTFIQHAFNLGEKKVGDFYVDGYLEIPVPNEKPYTIVYEYMGCFHHRCNLCPVRSRQTEEEFLKDRLRLYKIEMLVDKLIVIQECQWKKNRHHVNFDCKLSKFLNRTKITESDILDAVLSNDFFGLVKVKISTPQDVKEKYKSLNFPFIFGEQKITGMVKIDDLKV